MIRNLSITNIAVAKALDLEPDTGFTVLTGETGAGKSIIIDCLGLLCGAKGGREMIRTGETKAVVSGIFDSFSPEAAEALADLGITTDENGELEIQRILSADGKSGARINRRPCPLSLLKEVGPWLMQIQTQDERTQLANKAGYVDILDTYAQNEPVLASYKAEYAKLSAKRQEISELREAMRERTMMLDILKYQLQEIDSARLTSDDEEERLLKLRAKCKNVERVRKYSALVYRALEQNEKGMSAADLLERAEAALEQLSDVLDDAAEMAKQLENYRYEIIDIADRVHSILDDEELDNPENRLTNIESRLYTIDKLKKKYGESIPAIREFRRATAARIDDMESGDMKLRELEKEEAALIRKAAECASALHDCRAEAAESLSKSILTDLVFLEMPKVRFSIQVVKRPENDSMFTADGWDDVDFLLSVNPGEAMQSLGKIASGGELSRVMLALKASVSDQTGTIVFDEIDTGVSGSTSERIGILLNKLSKKNQVLAVTHSPQVAAQADTHIAIRKQMDGERAESTVHVLSEEERIEELARIIGGIDVTETQRKTAGEMLNNRNKK
ncbi:MAG: DNA repair protein RecN [Clostridia bacterium]|nr:DNA repair protein RecN [Clostridia bacterium]